MFEKLLLNDENDEALIKVEILEVGVVVEVVVKVTQLIFEYDDDDERDEIELRQIMLVVDEIDDYDYIDIDEVEVEADLVMVDVDVIDEVIEQIIYVDVLQQATDDEVDEHIIIVYDELVINE